VIDGATACGVMERLRDCEEKSNVLMSDHLHFANCLMRMENNLRNLGRTIKNIETMCMSHQNSLDLMQKSLEMDGDGDDMVDLEENKKKRKRDFDTDDDDSPPNKKLKLDIPNSTGIKEIRQKIPWRLNSGYVIHALLCCAKNKLGCSLIQNEYGMISNIFVSSLSYLKICCIYIVKNILCKKVNSIDTSTWDKTLKQHWFDGWISSKNSFTAVVKTDKIHDVNELSSGHIELSETEKESLLSLISSGT